MKLHIAAAAAAALSCAACANQAPMQPMGLGFHGQLGNETPAVTGNGAKIASEVIPDAAAPAAPGHMKQTLGGKVLSAIALERVTGRKPDPRRFKELR